MSNYTLVPESTEYLSVSGLNGYVTETRPASYTAVSGLGSLGSLVGAPSTGMWLLLAAAAGSAGYMYWKMRKAGVPLLSGLGHSGRTYYGVFPHHRGYGHHRSATGRWHFHRR